MSISTLECVSYGILALNTSSLYKYSLTCCPPSAGCLCPEPVLVHAQDWEQVLTEMEKALSTLAFPMPPVIRLSLPFMVPTWGPVRGVGAAHLLGWKIGASSLQMLELTTTDCGCPLHSPSPNIKILAMLHDTSPESLL